MGGKDTPPPCVSASPMQTPRYLSEKSRSFSVSSASSAASTASSFSSSSSGSSQPSPIRYVPPCKTRVNLQLQCPSPPTELGRRDSAGSTGSVPPRDGTYSPIRAYIDCISPQTLKCAIVGDSGVGKTSMLMRYVVDKFPENHSPTIYDKFSTSITVNGKRLSITMCDTAGQDDFSHLRPLCYPQVDVALICFSVIDAASYESVKSKWIREVRRHCPGVPVMIVGTQTDKREDTRVLKLLKSQGKRPISKTDGNKLAAQCKASCYIECSALTQHNVKKTFDEAIAAALELNTSSKHTPQCAGCTIL